MDMNSWWLKPLNMQVKGVSIIQGRLGMWNHQTKWGFLKIVVPPNHRILIIFANKPTILGVPYFEKPPNGFVQKWCTPKFLAVSPKNDQLIGWFRGPPPWPWTGPQLGLSPAPNRIHQCQCHVSPRPLLSASRRDLAQAWRDHDMTPMTRMTPTRDRDPQFRKRASFGYNH